MKQAQDSFIFNKIKGTDFKTLLLNEIESTIQFLFGYLPGTVGFVIRRFAYGIFFKSTKGMFWIQPRVIIVNSKNISIGRNFAVNSGTYINGLGGIDIGDYVLLGSNITISAGKHPIEGREKSVFERPSIPKKIVIEDDVWIGAGCVIMPGITLKKGTVIGANSTVTKDTEEYSINVGSPARKIGYR